MATYQRSDLAFPGTAVDLFTMPEQSQNLSSLLFANWPTVLTALIGGSGTDIDIDLADGTILRLTGTWTITILDLTTRKADGTLTGVVRLTGGNVLETISGSAVPFSVTYDLLNPANTVFDIPTLDQTINGNDNVLGGALNDVLKGFTGEDDLDGGSGGEDLLDGGAGNDTMAGGIGNDTYVVDSASDVIVEAAGAGTVDRVNALANYTLAANVDVEILAAASAAATTGINLTGNNLVNTVIGNAGDNALDGGGAADTLQGLGGNDSYSVDEAEDTIVETAGADTVNASVSYALATDVAVETLRALNASATTTLALTGNNLVNTVIGNAGDNVLDGGGAADTLQGLGGNDLYFVDNAGDQIVDTAGANTVNASVSYILATNVAVETLRTVNSAATAAISLTGNNLANTVTGNAGDNALDGGGAADTMQGLGGHDLYFVDNAGDQIVDTTGTDAANASVSYVLATDVAVETLRAINASATTALALTGNNLINTVIGNAGNNTLDGGGAADSLQGLAGNDTYIVETASDAVIEAVNGGTDLVKSSVTKILYANVENLTLTGTAVINGTGNALANIITGNAAANILDGGAGADRLVGAAGNDTYVLANSTDVVVDTAGIDTITSTVTRSLLGYATIDKLVLLGTAAINGTGNALANTITGNGAANILNGGAGLDKLIGGGGNDTYVLANGSDKVTDSAGIDAITSTINRSLAGFTTIEKLTLLGAAATGTGNGLANTITGNAANNKLSGMIGNDFLLGGVGNDLLVGGVGKDTMTGGVGADKFDFNLVAESVRGANRDIIVDFVRAQGDKIDLSTIDADTDGTAGNQAFAFIGTGAFTGVDGQLRCSAGIIQGDINGNKVADFEIKVNVATLVTGDFVL